MSDTGGGHRAACEAIQDALHLRYADRVAVDMVDVFRDYSPFPYKYMPEAYPLIIKYGKTSWGVSYELSNTRRRARIMADGMYVVMERGLKKMYAEHPADVVVCAHSLLTRPSRMALHARGSEHAPFVAVVTDLVSTHMFWYDRRSDLTLVPTQPAYERGLAARIPPGKMHVTGLPVHPKFTEGLADKAVARRELGWDADRTAVLIVGGGDGMGPLYKTARAIDALDARTQIAVVAGRNKALKEQVDATNWRQMVHSYGFVNNMPLLMAAADVLVTKAGPATICEACIAGLPVIMYDAIPGQETGNVEWVVSNRAGVFAPSPRETADVLASWLAEGPDGLARRAENARALARPNAVWDIADHIWQQSGRGPLRTIPRRKLKWTISKYRRYIRQPRHLVG